MKNRHPSYLSIWLAAVSVLLCSLLTTTAYAQDNQTVGEVIRLQGEVSVIRAAQNTTLDVGDQIQRSDQLITLDNALVEVQFTDGSSFTLDENAQVAIAQYAPGNAPRSLLQLTRGRLRSQVSSAFSSRQDSYQVETREGVMGVQGTVFEVVAATRETSVYVYSGLVSATSQDPAYPSTTLLRAGDFISIRLGEPIRPPTRFFGATEETAAVATADAVIGSGGDQAIISGGDQSVDPTAPAPTMSDQPAGEMGMAPPPPRPPSGG